MRHHEVEVHVSGRRFDLGRLVAVLVVLRQGHSFGGGPAVFTMYNGTLDHAKIIGAFQRHVPDCYVRDYRDNRGFITVCRGYKSIPWRDQTTTCNVERQVPRDTLVNLPRGNVTPATIYHGVALDRPGWREQFRRAARHLTSAQQRNITRELNVGQVFPGIS